MATAIISEDFDYVLEEERGLPTEDQTVFKLRRLTASERAILDDDLTRVDAASQTMAMATGSMNLTTMRAGLTGWDNFKHPPDPKDPDAEPTYVEFEQSTKTLNILGKNRRPPKDRMLDYLRASWLVELGKAIRGESELSVEEVGK